MRKDKKEAFQLRKEGKTYSEIKNILGVTKSTLSFWFKGFDWSSDLSKLNHSFNYSPEKILRMHEVRRKQLSELYERARVEAYAEFKVHKSNPLFAAGLMAYAGEGDKSERNSLIRIANADDRILLIFKRFLESYYPEYREKMRMSVLLYPDLDEKECLAYWSVMMEIPLTQFHKPVHIIGRHKTRRLRRGVGSLIISSKFLKTKILKLTDLCFGDLTRS